MRKRKEPETPKKSKKSKKNVIEEVSSQKRKTNAEVLKSFVKKGKGAANAVSSPEEAKARLKELAEDPKTKYHLTPKGILWSELSKAYGVGEDLDKFEEFSKQVVRKLSLLASGGENESMLGKDFNDFFVLFVQSLNLSAKMSELLEENGIPFSIEDYLNGDEDDE